ncbi:hypothetical protein IQ251_14480 [Saccharopolyspora sp. HNM0983]|uniref:Uncharacterized protein n=1 Tax=Saccharopolyspora montiporae TaxID=2781240 RepID=A0A929BCS4_9PSEU|nr:hypothetical protein [Saccharopolyspora sp. HNM0983]MBE9375656.1 hypothetical protein [Saccharopolyspora sp. HNM0983]
MSGFEVSPEDLRNSSKKVDESVSDLPRDILRGLDRGVDYGSDDVAKAVDDFNAGIEAAVKVLRGTAGQAVMALRGIADEYEGHDTNHSKDLATTSGMIGKGNLE